MEDNQLEFFAVLGFNGLTQSQFIVTKTILGGILAFVFSASQLCAAPALITNSVPANGKLVLGWNSRGTLEKADQISGPRSEEHTSELQSHHDLVCRLLLEKKNKYIREDG